MSHQAVQLGDRVRDTITGFEGVVTMRATYLYGCVRCTVDGQGKDGQPQDFYFDEQRLEVIGKLDDAPPAAPEPRATSGGPQSRQSPPRTGLR